MDDKGTRITLTGVPNVGKSTLFNTLTGRNVHTGNWSGKTVETSVGTIYCGDERITLEDLPGAYSLAARSEEERVAVRALMFSGADSTVVVCDESRLFSNLNFIIQAAECSKRCVICLNFGDAASKEGVKLDTDVLSRAIGAQVVRVNAKKKRTLAPLIEAAVNAAAEQSRIIARTDDVLEKSIQRIAEILEKLNTLPIFTRPIAMQALSGDTSLSDEFLDAVGTSERDRRAVSCAIDEECKLLFTKGYDPERIRDAISDAVCRSAEQIYSACVTKHERRRTLGQADRFLTGKLFAYPAMLLLFGTVLFVTVKLAAYPSEALETFFVWLNGWIRTFLLYIGLPPLLVSLITDGALDTLFTVVAVMLPPMAFFFPFFTLLEDSGYLPRVAYNLDRPFAACGACGKQGLTMCMGLGCNAVGITGARIIDSRRERILAIVTNSFVPCNGRFPILVIIIGAFFAGSGGGIATAAVLLLFILVSVTVTLAATFLLSKTLLRGETSFFALELPPYRRPDISKVLVRSLFDRTLKVLLRAAAVALPTGVLIWCLSNITVGAVVPMNAFVGLLDPVGRFIGLDGVMLTAFLLGLPANETVLPIALALYGGSGTVAEILVGGGWTVTTAVCASLFTLFHWPCSTAILTARRELHSTPWTLLTVMLPTAIGFVLCTAVAWVSRL